MTLLSADVKGDDLGEDDGSVDVGGWASSPPIPLFKLTPGMAANSHGIACAQLAGILADIQSFYLAGFHSRAMHACAAARWLNAVSSGGGAGGLLQLPPGRDALSTLFFSGTSESLAGWLCFACALGFLARCNALLCRLEVKRSV